MHRRELTLLASRNALSPDFKKIIGLIEDGKIDTSPWITHRAALEEVPERFTEWLNPASGVLKAVVSVGD
jgi:alcohol dehydrogenase